MANPNQYPEFEKIKQLVKDKREKKQGLDLTSVLGTNTFVSVINTFSNMMVSGLSKEEKETELAKIECILDFTLRMQTDLNTIYFETAYLQASNNAIKSDIETLFKDYTKSINYLVALSEWRALQTALTRFQVTQSVQSATDAVTTVCSNENDRLDSELSMIRYITWAIPSIGFIGTVRGIGAALGQAHEAMQGNIAGVTSSLGVAFNSTFIALLISMVVMFFMHQLQLVQERLVLDTHDYCENRLIRFLKAK